MSGRKSATLLRGVACCSAMIAFSANAAPVGSAALALAVPGQGDGAADLYANDIVVTATKRSESINRIPLTITAVSGGDLAAKGITETAELAKVVPGFVSVQGQFGSPVIFLRGVGYYGFTLSTKPTVTLYADEAPIPYSAMSIGNTLDLERVEVLKGPQGTLFGSNSTGGAVNYVAAKPTEAFKAGLSTSFGRFDEHVVSGYISGPLSSDVLVRLALSHEGRGDWQRSYTSGVTLGSRDVTSGRATIELRPSSRLMVRLTASGALDRSDTLAGQLIGAVNARPSLATYPRSPHNARAADFTPILKDGRPLDRDNQQLQVTLRADYQAGDQTTITSLTSYAYNRQDFAQDTDGTTLHINDYLVRGHLKSLSQELRIAGVIGGFGKWILGGNVTKDSSTELQDVNTFDGVASHNFDALGLPPIDGTQIMATIKNRSAAGFANVDLDLASNIQAHAGARYTFTGSKFAGCTRSVGNRTTWFGLSRVLGLPVNLVGPGDCMTLSFVNNVLTPGLVRMSLPENNLSWRLGLDWSPLSRTMFYASVSRGYKAGQFSNIAAIFADQYTPVKQEELTDYEIGFKSSVAPWLHINGALFHYDYSNKQLQGRRAVPIFRFLQALISVPRSRVNGAELEIKAEPIQGLSLSGAGTFVSSKIKGPFMAFTTFGVLRDIGGAAFPNTPRWQANANADYRWAVSAAVDLSIGGGLVYRSKSSGDFIPDPLQEIDAYTLLDAHIGFETRDKGWSGQLYARNLTNKYYWTSQLKIQEPVIRFAGMPRTYGISLSHNF